MSLKPENLIRCMVAEGLGTGLLVFIGCGVVHAAVLTGAQSGLWQVAIVWGIGVTLSIYCSAAVSGAHLNPAVSISLATWGKFPWRRVLPYISAQLGGAIAAAILLLILFNPFLTAKEKEGGLYRGQTGSELTAMCYGEYFPNPGRLAASPAPLTQETLAEHNALVPMPTAMFAEILGTAILALVIFAVTDERNGAAPLAGLAPLFIGLTVAVLISVLAPLTQACFNPARDFGPRLVAYFAGWGAIAIPGPRGGFFTVYILSPIIGAVLGGAIWGLVRPKIPHTKDLGDETTNPVDKTAQNSSEF